MDHLAGGHLALDAVQEADELLMAMALHILADDGAVQHVEGGEQGRGPVPFVVMGHGAGTAPLHGQAGLGAVKRLDLGFFVHAQDDGVRRRIDIEADNVPQFRDKLRVLRQLEQTHAVRLKPVRAPDSVH